MQVENLKKSFVMGDERIEVLRGVNLNVKKGEIVTITGPSGSGKSTLLHILGGLDLPDEGRVVIEGRELTGLKDRELSVLRNQRIGFVFQFHHLLPEFSVLENVMMPLLIGGVSFSEARERAEKILDEVEMLHRRNHKPSQISGGERQRTAIARSLVTGPSIVLADEPTGNLDIHTGKEIVDLIRSLNRKGVTFLIVTHNPEVGSIGDRVFNLKEGRLVEV